MAYRSDNIRAEKLWGLQYSIYCSAGSERGRADRRIVTGAALPPLERRSARRKRPAHLSQILEDHVVSTIPLQTAPCGTSYNLHLLVHLRLISLYHSIGPSSSRKYIYSILPLGKVVLKEARKEGSLDSSYCTVRAEHSKIM